RDLIGSNAERFYRTIQETKIMTPPTNCISPIGEKAILSGLYKQIKGEFYTAVSRPPAVYRGNPFVIEAGLAYGQRPEDVKRAKRPTAPKAEGEHEDEDSELARVIRYANRVPLLYQQSACATFKAVLGTTWKNYGMSQSRGALPGGPMVIFVHMASVWVPFTSESKEAIADYDEIQKEIRLALRECGRRLGLFIRRRERAASEFRRRNIFELYIEEVVEACNRLKGGSLPKEQLKSKLQEIAASRTGGTKTDEALGKSDAGPEGLPHSIIVTEEGVEGEVGAAGDSRSEDGSASVSVDVGNRDAEEPVSEETTGVEQPSRKRQKKVSTSSKGAAQQIALFESSPSKPKQPNKPNKLDKRVNPSSSPRLKRKK
ncbi:MAG: DNA topoisomerase VI subunit B, partial [Nitrospira sp.]|nr:DNA topoisomerase VI subunit B [Nitrospira sp.]